MAYDEPGYRQRGAGDQTNGDPGGHRTGTFPAPDYRGRRRGDDEHPLVDVDDTGTHRNRTEVRRDEPVVADNATPSDTRDRIGIHLGWEAVLLVGTGAVAYLLYRVDPAALKGPALDTLLVTAAAIGLLVLGASLSLRAYVPNLAVGPIAVAAGLQFAENGDRGIVSAGAQAIAIAVVGSVVVALIVVLLHVPGWAATLAGALGVVTFNQMHVGPTTVQGGYDPLPRAYFFFAGFAALAVVGGLLGTVPSIRRSVGWMRPTGDPSLRRGAVGALAVIGALVLSSILATVAGLLLAAVATGPLPARTGLEWTGIAIGAAMVAGTSAFGRRGGIFGTLLAVTALTLFMDYAVRRDLDIALFAIAAALLAAGLAVTRLVESFSKPRTPDAWTPRTEAGEAANWVSDMSETWPPAPAQPAGGRTDRWDEGGWGTTSR